MAQLIADKRDIDFVLYEQMDCESLLSYPEFEEFNKKMFDMVVKEARKFSLKEILPTYAEGDREGVVFENGNVKVPKCFHKLYEMYTEGEWLALVEDPEFGGQGLPHLIAQAAFEYIVGSNYTFAMYGILAKGAGKMVELFGTDQQKELFLKNIYTGVWGSTMLLTEPEAGSDLGALTTTAIKNDDGTYSLKGSKIFISNGEQDITDNIVHPVLARIEGAPEGTKGISIFIVPKIWVNEDGSFGDHNNIVCTGVEEKMGLHASPTCSMSLGDKGMCRGLLLGEENKGMEIMFHMMNDVRLEVGLQAMTHASSAYLYALEYAKERKQGRELGSREQSQVTILGHPDVRRMMIDMKAYVDGMRSFIYYTASCIDNAHCTKNEDEKVRFSGMVELLTPIVKTYCSEKGFDVCVNAMQVFGGYGYTKEYPVEQILRDCKITSIYEGSNGIQAMDFLGRKLGLNKGVVFTEFINEINSTINKAMEIDDLKDLAVKLSGTVTKLSETIVNLGKTAGSKDFKTGFFFAHPMLMATGDVIMAWMHLWRAVVAIPAIEKVTKSKYSDIDPANFLKNKNFAFYDGQIKTAEYFITTMLPVTEGKLKSIDASNDSALKIGENAFAS
ncbi:MAG: acyl-CoA dehydrogenase [Desulfobacterales bacterium]|nr:acyl-CoA dehydrogenase [Desulfobacterales bacterium]MCP4163195.1 acyl-CoA dehydrogenase [Deltaproteobacteria bacterium]